MTETYFVNYTIKGVDYQAGPYRSIFEATEHRDDIRTFDGIKCCYIATTRDARRQLIGEAA